MFLQTQHTHAKRVRQWRERTRQKREEVKNKYQFDVSAIRFIDLSADSIDNCECATREKKFHADWRIKIILKIKVGPSISTFDGKRWHEFDWGRYSFQNNENYIVKMRHEVKEPTMPGDQKWQAAERRILSHLILQ